ncbi:MAG: hypothetical protein AAF614_43845 [Chloroflexota bacterium]
MINAIMEDIQNSAKDTQNDLRETTQKVVHLQLGLLGFAYEAALNTFDSLRQASQDFLTRAIKRGEYVETNTRQEFEKYYAQVEERVDMLQTRFMGSVKQAEYVVEENIEMGRNIVEATQAKAEAALEKIVPELEAPFANYDSMTAKEIVARLNGMTDKQLHEVKIYEGANRNRVTIVREVNRLLP